MYLIDLLTPQIAAVLYNLDKVLSDGARRKSEMAGDTLLSKVSYFGMESDTTEFINLMIKIAFINY